MQNASFPDFVPAAGQALRDQHFSPPTLGEVQVVVGDSRAWASSVSAARQLLDTDEYARSVRLRREIDRTTYILAHAWWRVVLGRCLDVEPVDVPLTRTAAGQPLLFGTVFSTSLSHSGTWFALAVCGGAAVGVDIEQSPPHAALNSLMPSICAPDEIVELAPLPLPDREIALLALWTRKEALLKAFGVGLGVDPSHLSVRTGALKTPPLSASHQVSCRVINLELPVRLVGALAIPAHVVTVRSFVLEAHDTGNQASECHHQAEFVMGIS